MRVFVVIIFLVFGSTAVLSQDKLIDKVSSNDNRLYFYWGWNWGWYSQSDIKFVGSDYDFTLHNVEAKDRQSKFSPKIYFNPKYVTIPQYNFRLGYYFKENWDISFGIDHMKYVVQQNQLVGISGHINNTNSIYDGTYSDERVLLTEELLKFEHTDGLNYINVEVRHTNKILQFDKIEISLKEGLGIGCLYPKTNTTLLGKERYDEFHLSGYGLGLVGGINVSFYNRFFVQSELKGGFINLPNVRTTMSKTDEASQHFFFSQLNIVFGGIINLNRRQ